MGIFDGVVEGVTELVTEFNQMMEGIREVYSEAEPPLAQKQPPSTVKNQSTMPSEMQRTSDSDGDESSTLVDDKPVFEGASRTQVETTPDYLEPHASAPLPNFSYYPGGFSPPKQPQKGLKLYPPTSGGENIETTEQVHQFDFSSIKKSTTHSTDPSEVEPKVELGDCPGTETSALSSDGSGSSNPEEEN